MVWAEDGEIWGRVDKVVYEEFEGGFERKVLVVERVWTAKGDDGVVEFCLDDVYCLRKEFLSRSCSTCDNGRGYDEPFEGP